MKKHYIIKDLNGDLATVIANHRPINAECEMLEDERIEWIEVQEVEIGNRTEKQAVVNQTTKDAILAQEATDAAAEAALAPQRAVEQIIKAAIKKGNDVIEKFAVENVLLGITTDNMTGTVLDVMAPVTEALRSGSLHEAISRIKAIDPSDKDAKYITDTRLLAAVNELEEHLGIELSETL